MFCWLRRRGKKCRTCIYRYYPVVFAFGDHSRKMSCCRHKEKDIEDWTSVCNDYEMAEKFKLLPVLFASKGFSAGLTGLIAIIVSAIIALLSKWMS